MHSGSSVPADSWWLFNLSPGGQSQMSAARMWPIFRNQSARSKAVRSFRRRLDGENVQFSTGEGTFSGTSRHGTPTPTETLLQNGDPDRGPPRREVSRAICQVLSLLAAGAAADRHLDLLHETGCRAAAAGGRVGFGKSKAKLLTEKHGRVTFDVWPHRRGKGRALRRSWTFLRNPQKFRPSRCARSRKGPRCLVGPPVRVRRCLCAAPFRGRAECALLHHTPARIFVEMFVVVGASR